MHDFAVEITVVRVGRDDELGGSLITALADDFAEPAVVRHDVSVEELTVALVASAVDVASAADMALSATRRALDLTVGDEAEIQALSVVPVPIAAPATA